MTVRGFASESGMRKLVRSADGGVRGSLESRSQDGPAPKACLRDLKPYKGGDSKLDGADRVIKLSSNENPLGPSPRAADAFRKAADQLDLYPDGGAGALRGAIASVHGLDPDRIVCGAGSDEIISLLCQAYCGVGDELIHTRHAFLMYRISGVAAGATPIAVDERDLTADPEAILDAVTPRTRVVFLANPNNPTGTYLDADTLRALADRLPPSVLFVVDEAYGEYMRAEDYASAFDLVEARDNVVVTRTFSKIHGLAALRLGWGYCPPGVADALNRIRGPFNVNAPALAAGEAAIRDTDYAAACAIQNEVWRDWLAKELRMAGVAVPESAGNFILPYFGESGPTSAPAVDAYLRSQGLIVRRMESYGLPGRLRISIGASSAMVACAAALRDFMAEASA